MAQKKTTAVLLLTALMIGVFSSCGQGSEPSSVENTDAAQLQSGESVQTDASTEARELTIEEKLEKTVSEIPDKDYNGYGFRIATRSEKSLVWATDDVFSEAEDGEPINDAVYKRNRQLEEKLNIKVVDAGNPAELPHEMVSKAVLAGEDAYDVVTDGLQYLSNMATNGYLIDYNTISTINLDNEWWDHELTEGLSILGRVYYATGDISIMDNKGTWCVLFNKSISTDIGLADQYEMVHNGTWVIDEMHKNATKAARDIDGDGSMTGADQYGFLSEQFNTYALWVGGGEKIISKDKNDMPILSLYNDRSTGMIEKIIALQTDAACTTFHKTFTAGVIEAFKANQGLYFLVGMRVIPQLRDMEVEFGIIPMPKQTEAQDTYYSTYSFTNFVAYSIPKTVSDTDRTGVILDAMAGISKYTLTPAYYDTTLISKLIRDDESADMLDIILSTRSFDLGAIFDWGGSFSMFTKMTNEKTADIASRYAALESAAQTALEKFVESIQ